MLDIQKIFKKILLHQIIIPKLKKINNANDMDLADILTNFIDGEDGVKIYNKILKEEETKEN